MKDVIDYKIIHLHLGTNLFEDDITEKDFTNMIMDEIKNGYQPYGELKVSGKQYGGVLGGSSSPTIMTQVMVKYA